MSTTKNDRDGAAEPKTLEVGSTSPLVDLLLSYGLVSEAGANEVIELAAEVEARGAPDWTPGRGARKHAHPAEVSRLTHFIVRAVTLRLSGDSPACPSEPLVVVQPRVISVAAVICPEFDNDRGARLRSLLRLSDKQIGEVLSELLRVDDASEGKSTVALTYPADGGPCLSSTRGCIREPVRRGLDRASCTAHTGSS